MSTQTPAPSAAPIPATPSTEAQAAPVVTTSPSMVTAVIEQSKPLAVGATPAQAHAHALLAKVKMAIASNGAQESTFEKLNGEFHAFFHKLFMEMGIQKPATSASQSTSGTAI